MLSFNIVPLLALVAHLAMPAQAEVKADAPGLSVVAFGTLVKGSTFTVAEITDYNHMGTDKTWSAECTVQNTGSGADTFNFKKGDDGFILDTCDCKGQSLITCQHTGGEHKGKPLVCEKWGSTTC